SLATNLPRHQHHRHSLSSRKVHRTRSSGATHQIWDDPVIEHMSAYSPISSRFHRANLTLPPYQIQLAAAAARRRESVNSSIGATSIRRLLTINRGCRHKVPVHIRSKVAKNFRFLVIAHGLTCSILVPLFGLQGSNSIWFSNEKWFNFGPNVGSLLLSICFLFTSGMCLMTTRIVKKIGYVLLLVASYVALCIFLLAHLYPKFYILLPGYLILGFTLGPSWIAKWNLVVFFASRISCGQNDCNNTSSTIDGIDEHKAYCNRDERVRLLARWYHASENLGIVLGAIIAALVMSCHDSQCFSVQNTMSTIPRTIRNESVEGPEKLNTMRVNVTKSLGREFDINVEPTTSQLNQLLDNFYEMNEQGQRICGIYYCPAWTYYHEFNYTESIDVFGAHTSTMPLIFTYIALAIIALTLACLSQQIDNSFRCESIKGMTDTLLFAGPISFFIGTEQGYMLGDFTKAFVSCSMGANIVAGSLIGMGLMQLIVSCTLSMLLKHTKRYAVLAAGFFFHACLLLVLYRWKPSLDDSALFYVIAGCWGACNA
ncbi:UNC93-like protein, partial [Pseudolycoriella hygida]